jgi:hypothetical protein
LLKYSSFDISNRFLKYFKEHKMTSYQSKFQYRTPQDEKYVRVPTGDTVIVLEKVRCFRPQSNLEHIVEVISTGFNRNPNNNEVVAEMDPISNRYAKLTCLFASLTLLTAAYAAMTPSLPCAVLTGTYSLGLGIAARSCLKISRCADIIMKAANSANPASSRWKEDLKAEVDSSWLLRSYANEPYGIKKYIWW